MKLMRKTDCRCQWW